MSIVWFTELKVDKPTQLGLIANLQR